MASTSLWTFHLRAVLDDHCESLLTQEYFVMPVQMVSVSDLVNCLQSSDESG